MIYITFFVVWDVYNQRGNYYVIILFLNNDIVFTVKILRTEVG